MVSSLETFRGVGAARRPFFQPAKTSPSTPYHPQLPRLQLEQSDLPEGISNDPKRPDHLETLIYIPLPPIVPERYHSSHIVPWKFLGKPACRRAEWRAPDHNFEPSRGADRESYLCKARLSRPSYTLSRSFVGKSHESGRWGCLVVAAVV